MKYTLIGSLTSPYVRKLRLLLTNLAPYELKSINYLEANDSEYLKRINPINKIPILIDNDKIIYDSRVIYNYLVQQHQLKPLTIQEENILSAIDAALDTSINLFSLRRGGMDLNGGNSYIERQKERIPLLLNYLTPWAEKLDPKNASDWNYLSMSLYSYLYWGTFREILDLGQYESLKQFLIKFKDAPGVVETVPG